jgi:hypothetical protein
MRHLPSNPHDWALWLHEHLDGVQVAGGGRWQGTLPVKWSFQEIDQKLDELPGSLVGRSDPNTRTIEFNPSSAKVYQCVDEFFSHPSNLRKVPGQFTIRDLAYTHDKVIDIPDQVANYLAAVRLCLLLTQVADHVENNGISLYFLKSHDAKLEVKLEYQSKYLVPLPSIELFASEFVGNTHHQDQKRNIVRSALLDVFKGKRCVSISELLPCFEAFMDNVRSSYAMYTADFSYEKIRTEVDKQNLEDTLRLNKTVADIQNQLLALPAALLLAGAGIAKEQTLKNLAVWIGVCIFVWMMRTLVHNQDHSIRAIKDEIELRKQKLAEQPEDISKRFTGVFDALQRRVADQENVLQSIGRAIVLIWLVVTAMVLSVFFPKCTEAIVHGIDALVTWDTNYLGTKFLLMRVY